MKGSWKVWDKDWGEEGMSADTLPDTLGYRLDHNICHKPEKIGPTLCRQSSSCLTTVRRCRKKHLTCIMPQCQWEWNSMKRRQRSWGSLWGGTRGSWVFRLFGDRSWQQTLKTTISKAQTAFNMLKKVWNSREISTLIKVRLFNPLTPRPFLDTLEIFSLDMGQISSNLCKKAFTTWQQAFLSTKVTFYDIFAQTCTENKILKQERDLYL